jgi:hypothetical protein
LAVIGAIAAFGLLATPANAKSVWDQLNETAPRTVFDDIRDTAPRTIFDDLRESAPRTVFDDLQATAPIHAPDKDLVGE